MEVYDLLDIGSYVNVTHDGNTLEIYSIDEIQASLVKLKKDKKNIWVDISDLYVDNDSLNVDIT
jgi:hypothetical protein